MLVGPLLGRRCVVIYVVTSLMTPAMDAARVSRRSAGTTRWRSSAGGGRRRGPAARGARPLRRRRLALLLVAIDSPLPVGCRADRPAPFAQPAVERGGVFSPRESTYDAAYPMPALHPVLIAGQWRPAHSTGAFRPRIRPGRAAAGRVSDQRLGRLRRRAARGRRSGRAAAHDCRPRGSRPFSSAFAERIEARKDELVEMAHAETACPRRRAWPTSSCRGPPASCGRRAAAAPRGRGRCRRSTPSSTSAPCSRRSGRSWCSARTIFRSPSTASPAAISRRPSRPATR